MMTLTEDQLVAGWMNRPLKDLVEILDSRRVPVNKTERDRRPGPVPYYGATGQVGWIDKPLFDEELLLLGEDGVQFLDPTKPKAYMISGPSWVNNHAHVLRARKDLTSNRYLTHYLNHFDYRGYVNGTTRLKLTQNAMRSIPVFLPDLKEQEAIVNEIEKQFTRLDAAVATLHLGRAALVRYRASVLQTAFTGCLSGSWRRAQSNHLPSDWRLVRLGDVASTSSGGTPHRSISRYFGGSIPWVKSGELNDGLVVETEENLTEQGLANSSAKVFPAGTLCIALYGATVGKLGIFGLPAATNQAVCGVFPSDEVSIPFLFRIFQWKKADLVRQGKGGAQPNISQGIVKDLEFPLPPFGEQETIAEEIDRSFSVIAELERTMAISLRRSEILRRAILGSAFAGRLSNGL